ncbi:MAG: hypothetical protein K0S68_336 [Candidatus Saccharibacteria bacterium]|nr:hypothetical protein [Candidatus Saccharibacteria bacterium]
MLIIAGFLAAGFAGAWWFASRAAPNPASDLNHDGQVNVLDLSLFLNQWGQSGSPSADLNDDGAVTILDLSVFLDSWGPLAATPTPTPSAGATPTPTPTPTTSAGATPTPTSTPSPSPSVGAKPDASNTGPRQTTTRTLTSAQALAELRTTGYLSRVRITGGLSFSGSDGLGWVIEDSRIEGGVYTVRGYVSLTPFTGTSAQRPVLRYVEIVGSGALGSTSSSSTIYGSDMVIENADIYGGVDGVKAVDRLTILYSWIHDLDRPAGAHNDGIQIRNGIGSLIKGSRIDAYVGYSSDSSNPLGDWGSGGLQTGSVLGLIQATFEDNWFAGGRFTMRGAEPADVGQVDYFFRNNKWMQYGTSVTLGRSDLPPYQYGPVVGQFDVFTNNVWEHTGQPVQ